MRKLSFVMALLLGGCAGGAMTADQINTLRADIASYVAATCALQPEAASIAALIGAFSSEAGQGFGGLVNTIGNAICTAPVTASAVRRGTVRITKIVRTPKGPVVIHAVPYR